MPDLTDLEQTPPRILDRKAAAAPVAAIGALRVEIQSEPLRPVKESLGQQELKIDNQVLAEAAVGGLLSNAATLHAYSHGTVGEFSLAECAVALTESALAVHRGDLSGPEIMLAAQAVALNSIFCELARRASLNMGERLDAMDRYMRLALKAQAQCRVTLETLATIKNPPVVFARQANINNGGQQQVNNGTAPPTAGPTSHAAKMETEPSKLLEAPSGERLDFGATGKAGRAHPRMATVGAVNRTKDRGR